MMDFDNFAVPTETVKIYNQIIVTKILKVYSIHALTVSLCLVEIVILLYYSLK